MIPIDAWVVFESTLTDMQTHLISYQFMSANKNTSVLPMAFIVIKQFNWKVLPPVKGRHQANMKRVFSIRF